MISYLDRTHFCYSPESFPVDPHKDFHHGPRAGWCKSENVFGFLHRKLHCICPSFPTTSSLHSLEKKK